MMDLQEFSAWMEQGLDEGINQLGCERVMMAFILPSGEVMTGWWNMRYIDKQAVRDAISDQVIEEFILQNLPAWMETEGEEEEDE